MATGTNDFAFSWQRFLIESVLLKDHATYYILLNARGGSNPIVDQFAPGILYVKMVALLDEALVEYMAVNGLRVSHPYRNDLNGRIGFLDSQSRLTNATELHRIRVLRNQLAHESGTRADWDQLRADTAIVHSELKHLGFVGDQPVVQSFAERGSPNFEHGLPGVSDLQDYIVGATVNGEVAAELKWSIKTYRLGWDEERVQAALERGEAPPMGLKK